MRRRGVAALLVGATGSRKKTRVERVLEDISGGFRSGPDAVVPGVWGGGAGGGHGDRVGGVGREREGGGGRGAEGRELYWPDPDLWEPGFKVRKR